MFVKSHITRFSDFHRRRAHTRLPSSALVTTASAARYGYEGTAVGRAIRDAGWRARHVDLEAETVIFERETTDERMAPRG